MGSGSGLGAGEGDAAGEGEAPAAGEGETPSVGEGEAPSVGEAAAVGDAPGDTGAPGVDATLVAWAVETGEGDAGSGLAVAAGEGVTGIDGRGVTDSTGPGVSSVPHVYAAAPDVWNSRKPTSSTPAAAVPPMINER